MKKILLKNMYQKKRQTNHLKSYLTFFKCVAISDTLVRRIGIDMGIVKKSNAKKENVKIKLEKSFKVNGRFSLLFKNVNALQN